MFLFRLPFLQAALQQVFAVIKQEAFVEIEVGRPNFDLTVGRTLSSSGLAIVARSQSMVTKAMYV